LILIINEMADFSTEEKASINKALGELKDALDERVNEKITPIEKNLAKVVEAQDKMIADRKTLRAGGGNQSFAQAFAKEVEKNFDGLKKIDREKGRVILEIKDFNVKTVGDMALSSNLTGDQQASYGRPGLIPNDLINLRDLIPVRETSTGLAVTYRESAGEGAVARQTEGSAKAQVDSDFTEVKVVQRYIAAYQTASKQILQDLPFLQTTLPRILMRKYMQKENLLLYADIASGATANSPSGGNTVEKILNMIKTQRSNNFSASVNLITWDDWYNILVGTRPSTGVDYTTPGGVVVTPTGDVIIGGAKVTPASWVTSGDITVLDTAYIERVEVDALRVELSTEHGNNFTENKVTARVECRTDINILQKAGILNYGTAS
jgi:hypothetical protein